MTASSNGGAEPGSRTDGGPTAGDPTDGGRTAGDPTDGGPTAGGRTDGGPTASGEAGPARPVLVTSSDDGSGTGLILFPRPGALPAAWVGTAPAGLQPADAAALLAAARPCPLLPEHGEGWFGRPGLAGALGWTRRAAARPRAGTGRLAFCPVRSEHDGRRALVEAADAAAGLRLVTEVEAVPGGAIRVRHAVTNTGSAPYVVDSLEVSLPAAGPGRRGPRLHRAADRRADPPAAPARRRALAARGAPRPYRA